MRQIEFQTDSYVNPLLKVLAYLRSFKRTPKDEKKGQNVLLLSLQVSAN